MKLITPNGKEITATLEKVFGQAIIQNNNVVKNPDTGEFEFEYEGSTEILWNSQETVYLEKERIFLDTDGDEWTESELELIEE